MEMPTTTLAGHPLHPQLISAPLGLLPFSFILDVMHLATGDKSYADAAYYTLIGGYLGGLAAGAAGAADYLTIPPQTKSKTVANLHAALNLGIMGLYGLNLLMRSGKQRSGVVPMLLSAVGTAGLVASSWYGGELVYELGMRVKPVMEEEGGEQAPDAHLPGDSRIEEAFRQVEQCFAPGDGART
jgi:uncharacterized membrane protein